MIKQVSRGGISKGVKWIIIINMAVFFLQHFFPAIEELFAVKPFSYDNLAIGQTVTYLFIHNVNNYFHIFFNMIILWIFGTPFERQFGLKEFLKVYFISGVGLGLFYALFIDAKLIGASSAVYGIIAAFAYFWFNAQFFIFGLFPVRAKVVLIALLIFAFFSTLAPGEGNGIAHLGQFLGAFISFVYLQIIYKRYSIQKFFLRKGE